MTVRPAVLLSLMSVAMAGMAASAVLSAQAPTTRPAAASAPATRPTLVLVAAEKPSGVARPVYQDQDYSFWNRDYGTGGKQTPGLFCYSRKADKWMIAAKLSTAGAKLGRSPTFQEGPCSVGWDYAGLRAKDYADVPLRTSGSINLPDAIAYDSKAGEYHLRFNSTWDIPAVLTEFVVRKADMDRAFGVGATQPAATATAPAPPAGAQMHGMTLPPATGRYTPVMNFARSLARNATAWAISVSCPRWPSGTVFW